MKKAITILAILIVLVSAVFADPLPSNDASEQHRITLKTVVRSVLPQFRLVALENVQDAESVQTNETPNKFVNNGDYGVTTPIVYQVADISTHDIDVTFTAKLLNEAKTGGTYTLGFEAGDFTDVWKVSNGTVTKNNTVSASTHTLTAATDTKATTGVTLGEVANNSEEITIKFNGQECVAGDIAFYHVVYTSDNTVIDNDGTGYFANVTLTITFDGVQNPQQQNP